jgi:hypothetical protein
MSAMLQGPEKGDCGCGCGTFGTLKKPWRDGTRCVQRSCQCHRCMGKNNRRKGDSKARQSRKLLRLTGANTRHEEHLGGPVRYESKAGAQVGPIWTRFQAARVQSEQARAIGDHRPFVMAAHPDKTSEFLLIVSSKDWENVVAACAEESV